jgi:hypothetical protein
VTEALFLLCLDIEEANDTGRFAMYKRYPSPVKLVVELLFVVSVIIICMGAAFGKLDEFIGHPVLAFIIFCAVVFLWYRFQETQ